MRYVLAIFSCVTLVAATPDRDVNSFKHSAIFTGGLIGTGFFGHNVVDDLRTLGSSHLLKPSIGRWAFPGTLCLMIAASSALSRPLTVKHSTPEEREALFYNILLPGPAVGTGYYLAKMAKDPGSRAAKFLCLTYAALTTLCLHEACD